MIVDIWIYLENDKNIFRKKKEGLVLVKARRGNSSVAMACKYWFTDKAAHCLEMFLTNLENLTNCENCPFHKKYPIFYRT